MTSPIFQSAMRRNNPSGQPRSGVMIMLCLSVFVGVIYPFVAPALSPVAAVVAKGSAVAFLAVAATFTQSPNRWWLAAILAAGALGDVLLDIDGLFMAGAGAFAIGHVVAMAFYFQNPRPQRRRFDALAAAGLIAWGLAMPGLVSSPGTPVGALMLYSVLLSGMAAALLLSHFAWVAVAGALLFMISDTLLIMRLGGTQIGSPHTHGLLVWLTYYFGQALIFVGVATRLSSANP